VLVLYTNRAAVVVAEDESAKESEGERERAVEGLISRFAFRAPSLFVRALSQIFTETHFSLRHDQRSRRHSRVPDALEHMVHTSDLSWTVDRKCSSVAQRSVSQIERSAEFLIGRSAPPQLVEVQPLSKLLDCFNAVCTP
jgi:hypothetical protein